MGRMVVSIMLRDERGRRGKAPTGAVNEVAGSRGEYGDELGDGVEVTIRATSSDPRSRGSGEEDDDELGDVVEVT